MKEYQNHICKKCGVLSVIPPSRWKSKNYICRKCFNLKMKYYKQNTPGAYEKDKIRINKYQRNLRRTILEHYSGSIPAQCIQCGEKRYQCLELDHIHDNGAEHGKILCKSKVYRAYRGVNSYIYRDIKKNNYPDGFQTLCSNCHSIKTKGNFYGTTEYFKGY
jgi:hypothetical protein